MEFTYCKPWQLRGKLPLSNFWGKPRELRKPNKWEWSDQRSLPIAAGLYARPKEKRHLVGVIAQQRLGAGGLTLTGRPPGHGEGEGAGGNMYVTTHLPFQQGRPPSVPVLFPLRDWIYKRTWARPGMTLELWPQISAVNSLESQTTI